MLLEALVKYSQRASLTEEAEALSKAFHVMTVVPNQANDMMDIGRLQGFEGKITAQGKLLHRGPLNALDTFSPTSAGDKTKPIMKPFTCFLFEQIMIFSETVGKKTQFTSPVYVYKAHFLVSYPRHFTFVNGYDLHYKQGCCHDFKTGGAQAAKIILGPFYLKKWRGPTLLLL